MTVAQLIACVGRRRKSGNTIPNGSSVALPTSQINCDGPHGTLQALPSSGVLGVSK